MSTNIWSIVVAAGSGARFGAEKQLQPLHDKRVIDWSVEVLCEVGPTIVVAPADADPVAYFSASSEPSRSIMDRVERFVSGGSSRSESVRCGLACVNESATHVLVHDAARPLVTSGLVNRVVNELARGAQGVVPVVPIVDTLQTREGVTVDRSALVAVQTPQGFERSVLLEAHSAGFEATDDSTLVNQLGASVVHVEGDPKNIKVTVPDDMHIADAFCRGRE